MTDNPNFPPPWVGSSLEELIDCLERLQKASDEAKLHGTLKILLRDQIRAETTAVLRNIIKYAELVARGNIQILKSSGFELQKERRVASAGQLTPPEVFLKHGERRRSIKVKAKALSGAGSYEVQITDKDPNIEANWGAGGVHLKCGGIVLDNLNSGSNYWVRMRGIGANGPGEWSTPVTIMSLKTTRTCAGASQPGSGAAVTQRAFGRYQLLPTTPLSSSANSGTGLSDPMRRGPLTRDVTTIAKRLTPLCTLQR